mmetsp:Transcript_65672/g.90826  ORF Transcript_65672/g.90826 Transcript_65672/m.90826 type:complete len:123 (+) Transcript_65672:1317-1685(+)
MDSFLMFEGKSTFTSLEAILFIREVIELYPEHRENIFGKICRSFTSIRSHLVIRVALWIIGEYAVSSQEIQASFETIKRNVGSLPIYKPKTEEENKNEEKKESTGPKTVTKTVVLADGSYGQ